MATGSTSRPGDTSGSADPATPEAPAQRGGFPMPPSPPPLARGGGAYALQHPAAACVSTGRSGPATGPLPGVARGLAVAWRDAGPGLPGLLEWLDAGRRGAPGRSGDGVARASRFPAAPWGSVPAPGVTVERIPAGRAAGGVPQIGLRGMAGRSWADGRRPRGGGEGLQVQRRSARRRSLCGHPGGTSGGRHPCLQ